MSNVPAPALPAGPKATPRLALSVKLPVTRIVPPLRTRELAVGAAGPVPRFAAELTLSTPALTVTGPVNVLVPLRVRVPLPDLVRPDPAALSVIAPLSVRKP